MNMDNDPQFNENKNEFTPDKYHGGNMLQKAENTTSPYAEINQSYSHMMLEGMAALGDRWHASLTKRRHCSWQFFKLRHVT